ncbi:MAG: protease modulator HflC [Candidatus Omnitrophica bacterium]|nr:protease modulator HflC [Candidatus Omnitrophota bacterium]
MKNKGLGPIAIVILITVILVGNPFYITTEAQQAIVTQFGEPIGEAVVNAGLHFKVPFIQKVNYFEKRILEWDGYPNQIPTKDKRYIWVDTTARWRISDPLKFFQTVDNEQKAHGRLDDIIDAAVRDIVTSGNLIEIVRSSNRLVDELKFKKEEKEFIEEGALEEITIGREAMRTAIIKRVRSDVPQYGIELIDVRIKRVSYVEDVRRKVYDRMIAERKRAAEEYRSEGRGVRAEIQGRTDKELKNVLSQAYKTAQGVKGSADAESTKIYAQAYSKDPELYSFLKTLETYKNTVDKQTTIILTTDGDYFKYLKEISPK